MKSNKKTDNLMMLTEELAKKPIPPMYAHQKKAVDTTTLTDYALIIRGAGSGKTRIGEEIIKRNLNENALIIWLCPASLTAQASGDFDDSGIPNYKFFGQSTEIQKGKVMIISYDMLKRYRDMILSYGWNMCVCDEFHRTRNEGTIVNEATWQLRKKCKKFYALTATPFNNRDKDFFELISIVTGVDLVNKLEKSIKFKGENKGLLEKAFGFFKNMIFGKKEGEPIASAKIVLNRRTIWKIIDEYIDYVEPEEYQSKINRPTPKSSVKKIEMGDKEVKGYINIIKNKKLSTKEPYLRSYLLRQESSKIKTAVSQIKTIFSDKNTKTLVFSNFVTSGLGSLSKSLKEAGVPFRIYQGKTDKDTRDIIKNDFLSGKTRVLLISPSGFEGLNLKGATDCIVLDPHYNPSKTDQLIARGLRAGSEVKTVNITHYCSVSDKLKNPTVDEKIMKMSGKKREKNEALEGILRKRVRKTEEDDK